MIHLLWLCAVLMWMLIQSAQVRVERLADRATLCCSIGVVPLSGASLTGLPVRARDWEEDSWLFFNNHVASRQSGANSVTVAYTDTTLAALKVGVARSANHLVDDVCVSSSSPYEVTLCVLSDVD